MKRWLCFLGLGTLPLLSGCAAGNAMMLKQILGKQVTVSIAPDVGLPAQMTFDVALPAESGLAGVLMGGVKQAGVDSFHGFAEKAARPIGGMVTAKMREKLKQAGVFGDVTLSGGQAMLKLSIAEYGFRAREGIASIKPVLTVQAELVVPGIGTIWTGRQTLEELADKVKGLDLKTFAANPKLFQDPYGAAVDLVTQALVDKIAQLRQ